MKHFLSKSSKRWICMLLGSNVLFILSADGNLIMIFIITTSTKKHHPPTFCINSYPHEKQ